MKCELIQLYLKDNDKWLYNYIENHYKGSLKESVYQLYGAMLTKKQIKQVKKYIKKLLKTA